MIMEGADENWTKSIDAIVKGINESPTEALHGAAPADVHGGGEAMVFDLQKA